MYSGADTNRIRCATVQHRQLGHSGLRVSRLALGTMTWGHGTDTDEAAAQLDAFHEAGGTLVDAGHVSRHGRGEEVLATLLDNVVARDQLTIATHARTDSDHAPGTATSRTALLDALHASLRRLAVDHIDLWQLPIWDARVPIEETLDTLDTAVTGGKVRYIGVSNHQGWQLATAASMQRAVPGRIPLCSTQHEYSLLERHCEREIVPAAAHHGLALLPWGPLGRGVLSGKYHLDTPPDSRGADPLLAGYVDHHRTDRAARIVQAVNTAAEGLGTTPAVVALAWIRDRPTVAAPVVGARTTEQLKESLISEHIDLPPAIRAALDDVSEPTPTS